MASVSHKKKASGKPKGAMPKVGRTVAGMVYVITHICPGCEAEMTTTGSGYPQLVCSRCTMPMRANAKKVGN